MVNILSTTTKMQLSAQEYCNLKNIDVDITKDNSGWAVWVTFPDGRDIVCRSYIDDYEQTEKEYWKAFEYAAAIWFEMEQKTEVPKLPSIPKVFNVPSIPKIPSVPSIPKIPSVPKVPSIE